MYEAQPGPLVARGISCGEQQKNRRSEPMSASHGKWLGGYERREIRSAT